MNCKMKRYGIGGIVDGQMGPGGLIGASPQGASGPAGPYNDYAAWLQQMGQQPQQAQPQLGSLDSLGLQGAPAAQAGKKKRDWGGIGQAALLGALAGGVGGKAGIIAGPLMVALQQLLGGKFKQATSGKTPAYNPQNPYGDGRGGNGG